MAKRGRPDKSITNQNLGISGEFDSNKASDNITISGNLDNSPSGAPSSLEDATKKFTEERFLETEIHNESLSKVQHYQEHKPAIPGVKTAEAKKGYAPINKLDVIGKKPGWFYWWNINDPEVIFRTMQEFQRAEVVQDPDTMPGFKCRVDATGQFEKSKIIGDLILMRIPIEDYDEYDEYWKSQVISPSEKLKREIDRNNVQDSNRTSYYGEF